MPQIELTWKIFQIVILIFGLLAGFIRIMMYISKIETKFEMSIENLEERMDKYERVIEKIDEKLDKIIIELQNKKNRE